jgi:hypothetical protein
MRNAKMAAMLAADAPAARDLAFQIAVIAKIEQRRFRRGIALHAGLAAGLALLLGLVMPALEPVLQQAAAGFDSAPVIAVLVAASMALPWWATRRA